MLTYFIESKILRILRSRGIIHSTIRTIQDCILLVALLIEWLEFYTGLAPEIPEDLYMLIKKAVTVRKHLERNRNDKDSKFRLILIESRIHRLSRYYKTVHVLPPTWK